MHEVSLRVHEREDGKHEVRNVSGGVLAVCSSSAEAWRWIDRNTVEGQGDTDRHYRIRQSGPFS